MSGGRGWQTHKVESLMEEIIYIPLVDEYTNYQVTQDNDYDSIEIPKTLLPSRFRKEKNLFAIEIKNDLSSDVLLLPKDLVVLAILKAQPKDGDFVAYLHNNQINFKYFFKEKDGYQFRSVYPSLATEEISASDKIIIIGHVVLVVRNEISDLPATEEEVSIGSKNQFLVFHENIKEVIHKRRRVKIIQIVTILVVIIVATWFLLNIFNLNWPSWTGFQQKTLWDWLELLIIPAVISFGAFLLNQNQKQRDQIKTEEITRENSLQQYLDKMTELLLDDQRGFSNESSNERYMARTRTLTVLRGLDGDRKGIVVRFLHEATLVLDKDEKVKLQLIGSDLSFVNLSGTNLSEINLNGTNLYYANFQDSDLSRAYLQNAFLYGANLTKANLSDADLSDANLESANLTGADLRRANLTGTILTKRQLLKAESIEGAILPRGLTLDTLTKKA